MKFEKFGFRVLLAVLLLVAGHGFLGISALHAQSIGIGPAGSQLGVVRQGFGSSSFLSFGAVSFSGGGVGGVVPLIGPIPVIVGNPPIGTVDVLIPANSALINRPLVRLNAEITFQVMAGSLAPQEGARLYAQNLAEYLVNERVSKEGAKANFYCHLATQYINDTMSIEEVLKDYDLFCAWIER